MSTNHDRQWEERLEAGAEDDELLALAARLRRAGAATRATPPLAFQRQLRRDLLNQVAAAPRRGANVWRWVGSLAAVAVLAVVVGLMWFSISSSGRPSFGGQSAPATYATGLSQSTAVEGTTGDLPLPEGAARLESPVLNARQGLAPGEMVEVVGRWRIPEGMTVGSSFAHLLDSGGQLVAQSDGPLTAEGPVWLAALVLTLPDPLPAGEYTVAVGLLDENGARLPVVDLEVGWQVELPLTVLPDTPAIPTLTVRDVSPTTDVNLSGAEPITFTVRLAYEAVTPPAVLVVRIDEMQGDKGRGVAEAQVTLDETAGEVTVPIVLHPARELNAATELSLQLQLRAGKAALPQLIEVPAAYRWQYAP